MRKQLCALVGLSFWVTFVAAGQDAASGTADVPVLPAAAPADDRADPAAGVVPVNGDMQVPEPAQRNPVGVVIAGNGRVEVIRGDERLALDSGDAVLQGDTVVTDSVDGAQIHFLDGSVAKLSPNARCNLARKSCTPDDGQSLLVLQQGALRVRTPPLNERVTYGVLTPGGSAVISGGEMLAYTDGARALRMASVSGDENVVVLGGLPVASQEELNRALQDPDRVRGLSSGTEVGMGLNDIANGVASPFSVQAQEFAGTQFIDVDPEELLNGLQQLLLILARDYPQVYDIVADGLTLDEAIDQLVSDERDGETPSPGAPSEETGDQAPEVSGPTDGVVDTDDDVEDGDITEDPDDGGIDFEPLPPTDARRSPVTGL